VTEASSDHGPSLYSMIYAGLLNADYLEMVVSIDLSIVWIYIAT
jgi:hypothetical protein